jgi:hypothetical protein
VWSEVEDDVPPERLRAASANYRSAINVRDYGILTAHDLTPAAQDLARQLTADAATVYDKVKTLETWFQSDAFMYSLMIPTLDDAQPIDDFILNTRVGHCQLYATAMALMLRSLGIPCRVVSGYRGAEWIDQEGAYVVRADMAHLWVEVYFLDLGWFSFDPSPPIDRELTAMDRFTRRVTLMMMRAKMFWFSRVVGFTGFQMSQFRDITMAWIGLSDAAPSDVVQHGAPRRQLNLPLVPMLLLIWLAAAGAWALRRKRLTQRLQLSLDQVRAQRLFFVLRRRLLAMGTAADGKTAEEVAEEVLRKHADPPWHVLDALRIYNHARFGGRPLSPEQFTRLKQALGLWKPVRRVRWPVLRRVVTPE